MIVLGFNGGPKSAEEDDTRFDYLHDAAAALIEDGEVLCAIEEERLNRIKHTNCFPTRAIEYCLSYTGKTLRDVDTIVYVSEPCLLKVTAQWNALEDLVAPIPADAESFMASLFERELGVDVRGKLSFCDHHDAHIWSAYAFSGFEEALIFSVDGEGDRRAGAVCVGRDNTIKKLREYPVSASLGNLYSALIKYLGYARFDEYKVMGLAPYGDSSIFESLFEKGYRLLPEGLYELAKGPVWRTHFEESGILQQSRRKGTEFSRVHLDFAAALQSMLEKIAMHVLSHFQYETGLRNLCLAGGVAHNCTLNGKILRSGLFDRVFIQPASHDAGGALGAASQIFHANGARTNRKPMRHVYLGPDIGEPDRIANDLNRWSAFLDFQKCDDVVPATAALIAGGAVVGWVQGRSEFGPRALGNRSILADPRPSANKDLINEMVKKREQFRPFAPSVIEEKVNDFFEVPDCLADLSFMTFSLLVRESMRTSLGAVTHVDGTARVQTVSRKTNPRFWDLLAEFGRITGFPILLNTSFNNDAEPIVDSVIDAITCFLTTGINALVIGDYLVRKRLPAESDDAWLGLVPYLPSIRRLTKYKNRDEAPYRIESTKGTRHGRIGSTITASAYRLLSLSDDRAPLGKLLNAAGITDAGMKSALVRELVHLWSRRLLYFRPLRDMRNGSTS